MPHHFKPNAFKKHLKRSVLIVTDPPVNLSTYHVLSVVYITKSRKKYHWDFSGFTPLDAPASPSPGGQATLIITAADDDVFGAPDEHRGPTGDLTITLQNGTTIPVPPAVGPSSEVTVTP